MRRGFRVVPLTSQGEIPNEVGETHHFSLSLERAEWWAARLPNEDVQYVPSASGYAANGYAIVAALRTAPEGAVLADEGHGTGIVRLWTLVAPFRDGRTMRVLRRFFPDAEAYGKNLLRLGGFRTLAEAHRVIAEAKMTSLSPAVQGLVRWDTPESLPTLKHLA